MGRKTRGALRFVVGSAAALDTIESMVAKLEPTVTWRKSPSRLSLEKLDSTAHALESLAEARGEPLDPRACAA
jgi:hypothetical protein